MDKTNIRQRISQKLSGREASVRANNSNLGGNALTQKADSARAQTFGKSSLWNSASDSLGAQAEKPVGVYASLNVKTLGLWIRRLSFVFLFSVFTVLIGIPSHAVVVDQINNPITNEKINVEVNEFQYVVNLDKSFEEFQYVITIFGKNLAVVKKNADGAVLLDYKTSVNLMYRGRIASIEEIVAAEQGSIKYSPNGDSITATIKIKPEEKHYIGSEAWIAGNKLLLKKDSFPKITGTSESKTTLTNNNIDELIIEGSKLGSLTTGDITDDVLNQMNGNFYGYHASGENKVNLIMEENGVNNVGADGKSLTLKSNGDAREGRDITIEKRSKEELIKPDGNPLDGTINTVVRFYYEKVFFILDNMVGSNEPITMYPNAGSVGDEFYIVADSHPNNPDKNTDTFALSSEGMKYRAEFICDTDPGGFYVPKKPFEIQVEANEKENMLTCKVPQGVETGKSYWVKLQKLDSKDRLIAQYWVKTKAKDPAKYLIIDSDFAPKIDHLSVNKGPVNSETIVYANNVISVLMPSLTLDNKDNVEKELVNNKTLKLNYGQGIYKIDDESKKVVVERTVGAIIGEEADFTTLDEIKPGYSGGFDEIGVRVPDQAYIQGKEKKEVVITLKTTITEIEVDGSGNPILNNGKPVLTTNTYEFIQQARGKNGWFELLSPSYVPGLDEKDGVTPNMIQVKEVNSDAQIYETKDEVLILIKGKNYFVDRYYDENGVVVTHKPSIFIGSGNVETDKDHYQIAILPNDEEGECVKYIAEDGSVQTIKIEENQMEIFDDENTVIDGTKDKELGTKIVIRIPKSIKIKQKGLKNLLIVNPLRGTNKYGNKLMFTDVIDFFVSDSDPIIESVEPNIAPKSGKPQRVVRVVATKILADEKAIELYLDGERVKNITVEKDENSDTSVDRVFITFTAPKGRKIGPTQLLLHKKDGGNAVADFFYTEGSGESPTILDFNPKTGVEDTLVVVRGENFVAPSVVGVTDELGMNALKLIGTYVRMEGDYVDDFNIESSKFIFKKYSIPASQPLIQAKAEEKGSFYSPFYENADVVFKGEDNNFHSARLGNDKRGFPVIWAGQVAYSILDEGKGSTGIFHAYIDGKDAGKATVTIDPAAAGSSVAKTTIAIEGVSGVEGKEDVKPITFVATMDNRVFRVVKDPTNPKDKGEIHFANYIPSVTFREKNAATTQKENLTRMRLYYGKQDLPTLKDSAGKVYTLVMGDDGSKVEAVIGTDVQNGERVAVSRTEDGFSIWNKEEARNVAYEMITPYKQSEGVIIGHRSRVLWKKQLTFYVPKRSILKPNKSIEVINPDYAAYVSKKPYVYRERPQQAPGEPPKKAIISAITPWRGSVDGKYYVTVTGSGFEPGAKIFIDGWEVKDNVEISIYGDKISFKMREAWEQKVNEYMKNKQINQTSVPVVILNANGVTGSKEYGFIYVISNTNPKITKIKPDHGSSTGWQEVTIDGEEFLMFEPESDSITGEKFVDIYNDDIQNNLLNLKPEYAEKLKKMQEDENYVDYRCPIVAVHTDEGLPKYSYYYKSDILPKVYFGDQEAYIVDYKKTQLKVLTPPYPAGKNSEGKVKVYLINNDSAVSNSVDYTYDFVKPEIDMILPDQGGRGGNELKHLYGKKLFQSEVYGYAYSEADGKISGPALLPDVEAVVRFGKVESVEKVNAQIATVLLKGGLELEYNGNTNKIMMNVTEGNKNYKATFDYDILKLSGDMHGVYLPMGALKDKDGNFYVPEGLTKFSENMNEPKKYKQPYEYIKVYIEKNQIHVERGYAPYVEHESDERVHLYTPSYYQAEKVDVTYYNPGGGKNEASFTYTDSITNPKIKIIKPYREILGDDRYKDKYLVKQPINGTIPVEIYGKGFVEDGLKVQFGPQEGKILSFEVNKNFEGEPYDCITVMVPQGKDDDIEMLYPISVINVDGGIATSTDTKKLMDPPEKNKPRKPFWLLYLKPASTPKITKMTPTVSKFGTMGGWDLVKIYGTDFIFYEPYILDGLEKKLEEDLFPNGKFDDLIKNFKEIDKKRAERAYGRHEELGIEIIERNEKGSAYHHYYESEILPEIYFGEKKAQIVEFREMKNGEILVCVLAPPSKQRTVDVKLINNDMGVSNSVKYEYKSVPPEIEKIIPSFGRMGGSEPKEFFGDKMRESKLYGYIETGSKKVGAIGLLSAPEARVRFGEIDNVQLSDDDPNSGFIMNNRTKIELTGGLSLDYNGDANSLVVSMVVRDITYRREFVYDETSLPKESDSIYIPLSMLKDKSGNYYLPEKLAEIEEYKKYRTQYNKKNAYEYIRVYIDNEDRRMYAERGYAPIVDWVNKNRVTVYTPCYYTIGEVPVRYYNPDDGIGEAKFTYTNPSSDPRIKLIEPRVVSPEKDRYFVETVGVDESGMISIEISGKDFREGVQVMVGEEEATVKEHLPEGKEIDGEKYDLLTVVVPQGKEGDFDIEYPIIVYNKDMGLAMSSNPEKLIGNNYPPKNPTKKIPFYFVYRKALSFPKIHDVIPRFTSIAGGNEMIVRGEDFRKGIYTIIGTRTGVPIREVEVKDKGKLITFKTPNNMTLGVKDLNVINFINGKNDGQDVMHDVITVVSAPTVEPVIYDEKGDHPVSKIRVSGDRKVTIKGTGFAEGVRVFFGGEYKEVENPDKYKEPKEDQGLDSHDVLRYVKGGYEAAEVEFKDENTLVVLPNSVEFEGEVSIVVLNPDGGISDDSAKTVYRVPIPDDPIGLKAKIVANRYIELYDYVSDGAQYFEIYAYIGKKTANLLIENKYQDFRYLGVTEIEPYKIVELPGWDKMDEHDRIVFVVKGVNKYGQSDKYSNLAFIDFKQMKDMEELGPENIDGDIGVDDDNDYDIIRNKGNLVVRLATKLYDLVKLIDLSGEMDVKEKRISVPRELVRGSSAMVSVVFPNSMVSFTPTSLATKEFNQIDYYNYAYGNIKEEQGGAPSFNVRGKKKLTAARYVSFFASSNDEVLGSSRLVGSMDYSLKVPSHVKNKQKVEMYRYTDDEGKYVKVPSIYDSNSGFMTVRDKQSGYYLLVEPLY